MVCPGELKSAMGEALSQDNDRQGRRELGRGMAGTAAGFMFVHECRIDSERDPESCDSRPTPEPAAAVFRCPKI